MKRSKVVRLFASLLAAALIAPSAVYATEITETYIEETSGPEEAPADPQPEKPSEEPPVEEEPSNPVIPVNPTNPIDPADSMNTEENTSEVTEEQQEDLQPEYEAAGTEETTPEWSDSEEEVFDDFSWEDFIDENEEAAAGHWNAGNNEPAEKITTEELILRQNIQVPSVDEPDDPFLFHHVEDVEQAYLPEGESIYDRIDLDASIEIETGEQPIAVGLSRKGSLVSILEEKEDYCYIETGKVRGFVATKTLVRGDEFAELFPELSEDADPDVIPVIFVEDAVCLVDPNENTALTYLMITAEDPAAEKIGLVAASDLIIYQEKKLTVDEDGEIVTAEAGTLEEGGLAWLLEEVPGAEQMFFVESGDVRGFAKAEDFLLPEESEEILEEEGEGNLSTAAASVAREENKAYFYTITSVRNTSHLDDLRKALTEYALGFVGNKYVWGGTSLTEGVDCSGFTQQIYLAFGYYLPRTSRDQSTCGMQIPVSEALPGDLIFYARNGSVYHVAIYLGNDRAVHALNEQKGIVETNLGNETVWAVRILK